MASLRELKQRIANVGSTQQIIKAMDTIASSKVLKARAQLEGVRPIYAGLKDQMERLGKEKAARVSVYFKEREIKNSLYIVLTSDRGFAGAYNANVLKAALEHMDERNEKLFVVGAKGYSYFKRHNKNIVRRINDFADSQAYYNTESIADWLTDQYLSGEADEVFVVYTQFENVLTYTPTIERILPFPAADEEELNARETRYEPDLETVISEGAPLYLHMMLFHAYSESLTSEQASRMVTMSAAGDNASDLIEDLNKEYNRGRQAAITQELSEIVAGSNNEYR